MVSHASLPEEVRHALLQVSGSAAAKVRENRPRRTSLDILVTNTRGPSNQGSVNLRIPPCKRSKRSKRGLSPTAQRTENDIDDEDDVDAFGNLFDSNETGDSESG